MGASCTSWSPAAPDHQPHNLVFPADLPEELRAWPQQTGAGFGVHSDQVAAAVIGCWQRGELIGLQFPLEPDEDPRVLVRPAIAAGNLALSRGVQSA